MGPPGQRPSFTKNYSVCLTGQVFASGKFFDFWNGFVLRCVFVFVLFAGWLSCSNPSVLSHRSGCCNMWCHKNNRDLTATILMMSAALSIGETKKGETTTSFWKALCFGLRCCCLFVCLFVCLSACLPVCLSACLPVCLSACLPVCLSACLPVCLSACLPVCLSVCLPVCLSVCLFVCLFICLFVFLHQVPASPPTMLVARSATAKKRRTSPQRSFAKGGLRSRHPLKDQPPAWNAKLSLLDWQEEELWRLFFSTHSV